MPVVHSNSHQAPFWLPNAHLQTIVPSLFRKVPVTYHREKIATPDNDFLNLDWCFGSTSEFVASATQPLVILSHGLEGDTTRQYLAGMVRHLTQNGYHCLAWNYRGCGGEMNRQPRFYHSGETSDLSLVIRHALNKGHTQLYLMGFSLGGNVTLKYLGEQADNLHSAIKKAVVFSVPMDLGACSRNIEKPENKMYALKFLRSLKPKVQAKSAIYPQYFDMDKLETTKTIFDFDEYFTAPLHGFAGAEDYYKRCSAKHFVEKITIPTLIVNAKNDPLVPYQSLPIALIENLPHITLELTENGGHCGFRPQKLSNTKAFWSETRALEFLRKD
jgi:uncharacterized protein